MKRANKLLTISRQLQRELVFNDKLNIFAIKFVNSNVRDPGWFILFIMMAVKDQPFKAGFLYQNFTADPTREHGIPRMSRPIGYQPLFFSVYLHFFLL